MSILLWVLQGLLAVHTVIGAVWKVSNSEQAVPSLTAIPHGAWVALSGVEVLCAVGLLLPALFSPLAVAAPAAAAFIALEMLGFTVLHLVSGDASYGPVIYWLVVAALCAFIAYGRLVLAPV